MAGAERLVKCRVSGCGQLFLTNRKETSHLENAHGISKVMCPWCGQEYARPQNLQEHAKLEHDNEVKQMPEGAFARRYMFFLSVNPRWYLWGGKAPNIDDEASQRWMALVREACNQGRYKIEYDALEILWVEARTAREEARKKITTPTPKAPLKDITLAALNSPPPLVGSDALLDISPQTGTVADVSDTPDLGYGAYSPPFITVVDQQVPRYSPTVKTSNGSPTTEPLVVEAAASVLSPATGGSPAPVRVGTKRKHEEPTRPVAECAARLPEPCRPPTISLFRIMEVGCMDFLPPARRAYQRAEASVTLPHLHGMINWPPANWRKLSPQLRYQACLLAMHKLEATAAITSDPNELFAKYNMLVLPGTSPVPAARDPILASLVCAQFGNYSHVRELAVKNQLGGSYFGKVLRALYEPQPTEWIVDALNKAKIPVWLEGK